ncbi:MAG: transcription factor S [Candidatus Bathyarchaeota archaeon]|nr:transcription factor S [Candidatus Bathyarchaeota archaeon]
MEFCPNCGSRLVPKKSEDCDKPVIVLACSKCDYVKQDISKKSALTGGKVIQHNLRQQVTIIGKEDQKMATLPTLRVECPKCGNMEVYVWQVQTRGGDEASTQFMRCTKCNHTFREYT